MAIEKLLLDEEVKFELDKTVPRSRVADGLERLMDVSLAFGGGVLCYQFAKYNLGWGTWGGALAGVPAGLLAGLFITDKIFSAVDALRQYIHTHKQDALDKSHKDNTVTFTYRGQKAQCIMRPEYASNGHVFRFNASDGIIIDPLFSYQPQRRVALTFRFAIPDFEEDIVPQSVKQTAEMLKDDGDWWKGSQDEPRERYVKELVKKVKGREYKADFHLDGTNKQLITIITYSGENYDRELPRFAALASGLMARAKDLRTLYAQAK